MYEANLKFYRSSIIIFSFARSSNRLLPLNLSPCFENKEGRCLKKMVDSTLYEIVRSFDNSITSGRKYNRVNGGTVWKFIAFRKRNRLPQPPLDLVQLNDRNLDRFSITSPHGNTYSINFHAWPVFVLLGRVYFVVTLYPLPHCLISHPYRKIVAC